MFEINKKFTEEEIKEIQTAITFKIITNAPNAPATQEDFDKWCDEVVKNHYDFLAKEQEKAIKKANKKLEKANELGLTLEQYEEYVKAERNYKRHLCEIRKAQEQIEYLEKQIKYHNRKAIEWKEKKEKYL